MRRKREEKEKKKEVNTPMLKSLGIKHYE